MLGIWLEIQEVRVEKGHPNHQTEDEPLKMVLGPVAKPGMRYDRYGHCILPCIWRILAKEYEVSICLAYLHVSTVDGTEKTYQDGRVVVPDNLGEVPVVCYERHCSGWMCYPS